MDISLCIAIAIAINIVMSGGSATNINNNAVSTEFNDDPETAGFYQVCVPYIDYSTEQHKEYSGLKDLKDYEVSMPLHTNKQMLLEAEKERYLLKDYKKDFYFGSTVIRTVDYSLVEIYPEDRSSPFYYYEFYGMGGSIYDNGIIDGSSGVTAYQKHNLIWLHYGYGSNAKCIKIFKSYSESDVSEIIDVPFDYDIYNSYIDDLTLLAYGTFNDNVDVCIKIVDMFDDNGQIWTINRNHMVLNTIKFLNDEEIYFEYDKNTMHMKEIINFKTDETMYYKEEKNSSTSS